MSDCKGRVFNFSAGPGTLPVEVLEQCKEDLLNYKGCGMSVMEMSHRSAEFEQIIGEAEADLRELLNVPSSYRVLFLQGGASLQFTMIPESFLREGCSADYVVTGAWGKKAVESAECKGQVRLVFDDKAAGYRTAPGFASIDFDPHACYVHFTSNETIQGVEFHQDPDLDAPVFCDMSSDILSRPVEIHRYAGIYAGSQKNMGPAGVTVVIISDDALERAAGNLPPMLDYRIHSKNNSLYNTPCTWAIYVTGLVYKHLLRQGGVEAANASARKKSDLLYSVVDGSSGFYKGHAEPGSRSRMNVVFTLPSAELTTQFVKQAEAKGLSGLAGHRSVGGIRASIYNAFPMKGCEALAEFMRDFQSGN